MGATILAIIYLIVLFFMNKSFKKSLNEMQEIYDGSTKSRDNLIKTQSKIMSNLTTQNETRKLMNEELLGLNRGLLEEVKELKGKLND